MYLWVIHSRCSRNATVITKARTPAREQCLDLRPQGRSLDTSSGAWASEGQPENLQERVKGWAIGTEMCGIQAVLEKGFDWLVDLLHVCTHVLIHVQGCSCVISFTHLKSISSLQQHFFSARLWASSWGRDRGSWHDTPGPCRLVGRQVDAHRQGKGWPWGQDEWDRSVEWEFRMVQWGENGLVGRGQEVGKYLRAGGWVSSPS